MKKWVLIGLCLGVIFAYQNCSDIKVSPVSGIGHDFLSNENNDNLAEGRDPSDPQILSTPSFGRIGYFDSQLGFTSNGESIFRYEKENQQWALKKNYPLYTSAPRLKGYSRYVYAGQTKDIALFCERNGSESDTNEFQTQILKVFKLNPSTDTWDNILNLDAYCFHLPRNLTIVGVFISDQFIFYYKRPPTNTDPRRPQYVTYLSRQANGSFSTPHPFNPPFGFFTPRLLLGSYVVTGSAASVEIHKYENNSFSYKHEINFNGSTTGYTSYGNHFMGSRNKIVVSLIHGGDDVLNNPQGMVYLEIQNNDILRIIKTIGPLVSPSADQFPTFLSAPYHHPFTHFSMSQNIVYYLNNKSLKSYNLDTEETSDVIEFSSDHIYEQNGHCYTNGEITVASHGYSAVILNNNE